MKFTLSSKQEEIASFENGSILVKASAGSGKTRVLTERISRLAKLTKRKILAITFSNKASEEIRDRLEQIDENLLDKVFVGTFHSFCNYVLENHGNLIGFKDLPQVYSELDDRLRIVQKAIIDTPSLNKVFLQKNKNDRHKFESDALEVISKIKRNVILDEDLEEKISNNNLILLYLNYRDIMNRLNVIDFDDLLFYTYKLFISNESTVGLYRRTFEYICVDEAQDLNMAQYMVLKALTAGENKNVMMVGDPNQSIYGFNGSSAKFMEENFINDFKPTIKVLSENYRSSKAILQYADKVLSNSNSNNIAETVFEGECKELAFESVEKETEWVINQIKVILNKGKLEGIEGRVIPEYIAILARNKFVLSPIEDRLKKENLPFFYKVSVKTTEFVSDYGKILYLALQVKINPKDILHLSQITSILKMEKSTSLEEILSYKNNNKLSFDIMNFILNLKDDGHNFINGIDGLINNIKKDTYKSIVTADELQTLYNDLIDIKEQWNNYRVKNMERSLSSFRNAMALGQTLNRVEDNGITLSTIHTMKGQQSEIVFLIGMDNQTFPDYRAIKSGGLALKQEKNNLYVAITRAKRYLYVTYPLSRNMPWGEVVKRYKSTLLPK